jgi:flagellar assembly protein FliH
LGLIKSEHAPSQLKPFSMNDIEEAARRMLLRARRQSEELLASAQAEAEELKKTAHAQGLIEGRNEGRMRGLEEGRATGQEQALNEARARLTELSNALVAMVTQLDQSRQDMETEALREVVDLAVAIARRVTKRQGQIDPEVLMSNLADAMKLVVHASDVRLAVHPSQRQVLEETLPRLQMQWPNLEHVELSEDDSLAAGGCRITTRHGQVDADLEQQLDRIIADLLPAPPAAAPNPPPSSSTGP